MQFIFEANHIFYISSKTSCRREFSWVVWIVIISWVANQITSTILSFYKSVEKRKERNNLKSSYWEIQETNSIDCCSIIWKEEFRWLSENISAQWKFYYLKNHFWNRKYNDISYYILEYRLYNITLFDLIYSVLKCSVWFLLKFNLTCKYTLKYLF